MEKIIAPQIALKITNQRLHDYGLPCTATPGSAGYDLRACIDEPVTLSPDSSMKIPTGIAVSIEDNNFAAFLFPRSGLAASYDLTLQNCVGVIDSDYQGEISVLLRNEGQDPYRVNPGDRIAQMIFMPVVHPMIALVMDFDEETERGEGGFGHTGISSNGIATLESTGISHEPGTQDEPAMVSPGELLGNDDPLADGVDVPYSPPPKPNVLEKIIESHEQALDSEEHF